MVSALGQASGKGVSSPWSPPHSAAPNRAADGLERGRWQRQRRVASKAAKAKGESAEAADQRQPKGPEGSKVRLQHSFRTGSHVCHCTRQTF